MKRPLAHTDIDEQNNEAWQTRNADPKKAIKLASVVLKQARAINYPKGIADSLHTIGFGQARISDYINARMNANEAIEIYRDIKDRVNEQKVLNTLGTIEGISGNLSESIIILDKALKLAEKLDEKLAVATAYHNLAIAYGELGDFDVSLEYYLQALELYEELGETESAHRTLQNIGVIHINLENYDEALTSLLKTAELLKNTTDKETTALAYINIGRSYSKLEQYDQALNYLNNGYNILKDMGSYLNMSYALGELGIVYMKQGRYDKAQNIMQKSIGIKLEYGDYSGLAESYYNLGRLYLVIDKIDLAIETFLKALQLASDAKAKLHLKHINKELSTAYEELGDYKNALKHLRNHLQVRKELFEDANSGRTQAMLTKHKIAQSEKDREIVRRNTELNIANERLQLLTKELERQAKEDSLTQLYNRRYFDKILEKEYGRSKRYLKNMSVMICDIDDFKQVNDRFSHQIGDKVLIKVAEVFKENIRENDTIARFGGEEFVAVFPESDSQKAYSICERIRLSIENYPWHKIEPNLKVTVSLGICDDTSLGSGETMISRADDALYEVKNSGKNNVKIWQAKEVSVA